MRPTRTATPSAVTALALLLAVLAGLVAMAAMAPLPARAEETLARISWEIASLPATDALDLTLGQAADGSTSLRVRSETTRSASLPLWRREAPPVRGPGYALAGLVRYQGVGKDGYLEMWSHFDDGSAYFSRTLAATGPTRSLSGHSDWRQVLVPFHLGDSQLEPTLLELNLYLPAGGEVEIGSLSLVQYLPGENPLGAAAAGSGAAVRATRVWALGAAATALAGATLLAIVIAKKRRSALRSELRKIEALDAS